MKILVSVETPRISRVRRPAALLATFGFVAFISLAAAENESIDLSLETHILPLLEVYCMDCHNGEDMKGDFDMERFETIDKVLDSLAVWQRMAMRIKNHEMPPEKRPQPTDEERAELVGWIGELKFDSGDCDRLATEESVNWYRGYVMSRRLNRGEYTNTIRDLLGLTFDASRFFPADGAGGEGFDNTGSALFLSAIQIEKYLDAADEIVNRVVDGQNPDSWELVLGPGAGVFLDQRAAARRVLREFLPRAWRRPVEEFEIRPLLALFAQAYARGDGYEASVALPLKAALISPNFLFLVEPEPLESGVYALGSFQLASRLSYFLWGSMPDAELVRAAESGALIEDDVLRQQTLRMLRDPKVKAFGDLFATQWLGIAQFGELTRPDAERFPEFDTHLAESMRAEVSAYFNHIISQDRSLLELLDSNYTFMNDRLAEYYGIGKVTGNELRLVPLMDTRRGGVLGMGAILTSTSHPLRTSPVLRGKWVLERLLGDRIPPPPPNVAALPEDNEEVQGTSLRARMEAHRAQEECASCHQRMDPIGFGLENFDPIGRWRETESGVPIDAKGVLPDGTAFRGPEELKAILLDRRGQFARHISRKALGYALGRSLNQYDTCVIDRAVAALEENDYRPSAMITEIVLSYPFRHRYSGGDKS